MTEQVAEREPIALEPLCLGQDNQLSSNNALIFKALDAHPHFRGRRAGIHIKSNGKMRILTGRLPSFYLKQLLQETLRCVKGVQRIQNDIDVVYCNGNSSVRDKH